MLVLLVAVAAIPGCSMSERSVPDSALSYGAHDQVTTCDSRWSSDGVAPPLCDHGCAVRPQALPCNDPGRPCSHTDAPCMRATSPSGPPVSCAATIEVDGARGCCVLRVALPALIVPTFYECSAP